MLAEMRAFCTYFDHRYLTRGLALWESLQKHAAQAPLYALCMDDLAWRLLRELALPNLHPIALAELEASHPELLDVKPTRSTIEYYFTVSPLLPLFVLARNPELASVSYVDADLWFFSSIEPLFDELGASSVGIIRHRFPPALKDREVYGIFNVGCLIFRNDAAARLCLEWWRDRCLEWCYDRVERDRFADQKYLDRFPSRFPEVAVLENKGANAAPWNIGQYDVTDRAGRVFIDDVPLMFFHFHGLRHWRGQMWQLGLADYAVPASNVLVDAVYRPYIETLRAWAARVPQTADTPAIRRKPASVRLRELLRAPYYLSRREIIRVPPSTP